MRLTILSSGSSGNALLLQSGADRIFIDAGLPDKLLRRRLLPAFPDGVGVHGASAAFLTHEHGDHVAGAEELSAQGVHLYGTPGTLRGLRLSHAARQMTRPLLPGAALRFGSFSVFPVPLPHDAAQPVGYVIGDGQVRLGVLTDCGHAAAEVAEGFAGCDVLVLETNHDRALLLQGPYPLRLKRRIASDEGHLSNEQSAELLAALLRRSAPPRLLICAHLSKTNNRPELAKQALAAVLGRHPTRLLCASQDTPLGPLELAETQLSLF